MLPNFTTLVSGRNRTFRIRSGSYIP